MRQPLFEFFAQDSWKVSRRLTLDYASAGPSLRNVPARKGSSRLLAASTTRASPPFFVPVTQNGTKVAQNPLTGALAPAPTSDSSSPGGQSGAGRGTSRRPESPGRLRSINRDCCGSAHRLRLRCLRQRQDGHPRRLSYSFNPRLSVEQHGEQSAGHLHADHYYGDMRSFLKPPACSRQATPRLQHQ